MSECAHSGREFAKPIILFDLRSRRIFVADETCNLADRRVLVWGWHVPRLRAVLDRDTNNPDKPLPMTGKMPTPKEVEWARFAVVQDGLQEPGSFRPRCSASQRSLTDPASTPGEPRPPRRRIATARLMTTVAIAIPIHTAFMFRSYLNNVSTAARSARRTAFADARYKILPAIRCERHAR
jgi:hypothetical protein